jgi:hypothetical protein
LGLENVSTKSKSGSKKSLGKIRNRKATTTAEVEDKPAQLEIENGGEPEDFVVLVENNILDPDIVSEVIEDDISNEPLGEKVNEPSVERQSEVQQEEIVEPEVLSEGEGNLKIQFSEDVVILDTIKSFLHEVMFLQEGRFQRDMKELECRVESRVENKLRKEFELKLAESRLNLSDMSEDYVSEGEESNGTVKDLNEVEVRNVGSVRTNESVDIERQIEISSDEEDVNKQLVDQLQKEIDEESITEDSQVKVKGPKTNELLVKLKRVVHKRPRNSDSDTEGESENVRKRPVRRQKAKKCQNREGLNDRQIAKEAEMRAECERMKKIADDDRKELKRQIKEVEKLKKMEAKVARSQDSDELCIDTDGEE